LIDLYWQVGAYISQKLESAEWGAGVVDQLASHLSHTQPGLRGFTRSNLFRMRQYYETYREDEKVAPLVRLLTWTNNLIIMGQSKRHEEREFYLKMAIQGKWGRRRQLCNSHLHKFSPGYKSSMTASHHASKTATRTE
jgi:predicted nuclease of restriction endonuclease-like (RecB) superfamily